MLKFHRGDRNGLLLGALVVTLVISPYVERSTATGIVFAVLLMMVMVTGALSAAQTHGRIKLVGISLAVAILAAFVLAYSLDTAALPLIRVMEILFLLVVGLSVLGKVLSPGEVNLDKIFGALAVYLIAGLVLGLSCELLETLVPGSFAGALSPEQMNGGDMIYFGYVTLTTLGYGDIAPATAKARSLAMMGAIVGPLYIAILVARLVGDLGTVVEEKPKTDMDRL